MTVISLNRFLDPVDDSVTTNTPLTKSQNQNCLQQQPGKHTRRGPSTVQDRAWVDMRLHESHDEGGFGVSHNTITRHVASYTTNARFVAFRARVGTSKPNVLETNVSQNAGSKASLAEVGLMASSRSSHERGFQKSSRALTLSVCSSRLFISTRRVESGTVALCFCGM